MSIVKSTVNTVIRGSIKAGAIEEGDTDDREEDSYNGGETGT